MLIIVPESPKKDFNSVSTKTACVVSRAPSNEDEFNCCWRNADQIFGAAWRSRSNPGDRTKRTADRRRSLPERRGDFGPELPDRSGRAVAARGEGAAATAVAHRKHLGPFVYLVLGGANPECAMTIADGLARGSSQIGAVPAPASRVPCPGAFLGRLATGGGAGMIVSMVPEGARMVHGYPCFGGT